MKIILAILSIFILFTSCEDVIEIDLKSIEPKLVIEGSINDLDDKCIVKLSKTGDYFKPGIYKTVSNADVFISNDTEGEISFEETEPGIYLSGSFQRISNATYTLKVISDGIEYTADALMPQKVEIDSLTFEETPLIMEFTGGYVVICHFRDLLGGRNYFRMKAYNINDSNKGSESIFVFNDDLVDGNRIEMPWENEQFFPSDTVVVELQTLDRSSYLYYQTLFSIIGSELPNSNPANPETNLNNDALGFFGSWTISRDTIVIKAN